MYLMHLSLPLCPTCLLQDTNQILGFCLCHHSSHTWNLLGSNSSCFFLVKVLMCNNFWFLQENCGQSKTAVQENWFCIRLKYSHFYQFLWKLSLKCNWFLLFHLYSLSHLVSHSLCWWSLRYKRISFLFRVQQLIYNGAQKI